jgi:hypothetical protein
VNKYNCCGITDQSRAPQLNFDSKAENKLEHLGSTWGVFDAEKNDFDTTTITTAVIVQ